MPGTTKADDVTDYHQFLASKRISSPPTGFHVEKSALNPRMHGWQADITQWALKRGRAALFEDCGLGKTIQELEWGRKVIEQTGKPVLLLAPVLVGWQTVDEAKKFNVQCDVKFIYDGCDTIDGINVTNYERLHKFTAERFGGVILDECFPAGTLVDTPVGPMEIERIIPGYRIYNASGTDIVSEVHRREVQYAVAFTAGSRIVCSPNHPVFTQRGWVSAQDLEPGDSVLQTKEAVRILRDDISAATVSSFGTREILREILFSEMADETAGTSGESSYTGSTEEERRRATAMDGIRQPEGKEGEGSNRCAQSDVRSELSEKSICHIETHEAQTFRAWGQWKGSYSSADDFAGCTRTELDCGISFVTGPTNSGLSVALQNRLSEQRAKSRYRSGWSIAPSNSEERCRPAENCEAGFVRVESLEILQPGNPELEKLRDADGKLYFYDLGGTRHPSFSVSGLLVHNSSILKNFMGVRKRQLMEKFARTPYKLTATATPAPNDLLELGNQAAFLDVMPANEMIARWFIADSMHAGNYRLRKHGEADFWRWVSSWAVSLASPADLGHDAGGYNLPELRVQERIVDSTDSWFGGDTRNASATNVHDEKRKSLVSRCRAVADLTNNSNEQWVVWCGTDYEADELNRVVTDSVEIRGKHTDRHKEAGLKAFLSGEKRVLITKSELAGFGLNFQCCHNTTWFASYSFERFYQAIRRLYRFGQQFPVNAYLVASEKELGILDTMKKKIAAHEGMRCGIADAMRDFQIAEIYGRKLEEYKTCRAMSLPPYLTTKS